MSLTRLQEFTTSRKRGGWDAPWTCQRDCHLQRVLANHPVRCERLNKVDTWRTSSNPYVTALRSFTAKRLVQASDKLGKERVGVFPEVLHRGQIDRERLTFQTAPHTGPRSVPRSRPWQ